MVDEHVVRSFSHPLIPFQIVPCLDDEDDDSGLGGSCMRLERGEAWAELSLVGDASSGSVQPVCLPLAGHSLILGQDQT